MIEIKLFILKSRIDVLENILIEKLGLVSKEEYTRMFIDVHKENLEKEQELLQKRIQDEED